MNYDPASALVPRAPGGAVYGTGAHSQIKEYPFPRWQRRRLNAVAICLSLFVPWGMFCAMFWVMAFSLHYKHPFICYALVLCGLAFVGVLVLFARDSVIRRERGDPDREPTWLIFLAATTFLAWLLGVLVGDLVYYYIMEPYYASVNLNTYLGIDPSRMTGQQLMDASRLVFTEDSKLDIKRSMGFKNMEIYCVAPIISGKQPMATYDFWAVGQNCCSGNKADFHCGEFNNPNARAGLRLMRDDPRPFYRLAVQQAEAAYDINAGHPLFFEWMQDPNGALENLLNSGAKWYLLGIFTYFLIQLFLVLTATLLFARITHSFLKEVG